MKIALISDLHANVPALRAVLEAIDRSGAEHTYCLGDIVDLGPDPSEVIELLQRRDIPCLMGNHDPFTGPPTVPEAIYAWTLTQLCDSELAWLRALPRELAFEFGEQRLLCVHGSPRAYDEQILDATSSAELDVMLAGASCDVLACGHTHVQLVRQHRTVTIVNSGSVGMPFESAFTGNGSPRIHSWAEYALIEFGSGRVSAELCRVDYDIEAYFSRVRARMPDPEGWISAWLPP